MAKKPGKPRCIIIAGPNGAGKTTFARDYLPGIAGLIHFINADLIAGGISPLCPELAAVQAGRIVLRELDRLVEAKVEFAFESTLSGLRYVRRIEDWKARGYLIEIVYIRLASSGLALSRIAARVRQGGHHVPRADVLRRFKRGWVNFLGVYRPLADHWAVYESSESEPKLLGSGRVTIRPKRLKRTESFAAAVGRGLRRAARTARKVARMYGTPVYIWEKGKVVAKDPNDAIK